ncbi:MAG: translation initiation factor IF-3 [Candidatus Zixiibacteriota bacterium]
MKNQEIRVNERIRVSPIRLIGPDSEQVGIIPTAEALERAREAGLDLVEVSPTARPPVCRILDYGKYKYNLAKKAADSKKKQHSISIKGMRYRPKTEEHDYQFKLKHVRSFLGQGNKVKCFVLFRGREKAHTEFGRRILDRLVEDLQDIAIVESMPQMEGHSMNMLVAPLTGQNRKKDKGREKKEEVKQQPVPQETALENKKE